MPVQDPRKSQALIQLTCVPMLVMLAMVALLSSPIIFELIRSAQWGISSFDSVDPAEIGLSFNRIGLLIRSIFIAGLIALIGVCMGIPLGRVLASRSGTSRRRFTAALLILPIWLPSTMVYAAGNLIRDPGSIVGHALLSYATSSESHRWVTIWAGYAIAIIGLGIWSAPIAGVFIASSFGRQSNLYNEMLALEPLRRLGRLIFWIRLHLRVLFRAWVMILILMFGSATALHLAQLETWSIVIWRQLAEKPVDQWGGIWISAWPTLIAGVIGARILTKNFVNKDIESKDDDRGQRDAVVSRSILILSFIVFFLGGVFPMLMMLLSLDDLRSLIQFWRFESAAVRDSGLIAVATAGIVFLLTILVAMNLGHQSLRIRRVTSFAVFVLCVLGLIPGVLVGASIARSPIELISTGWTGAFLASCIRASFLGVLVGALCASSESSERKSLRWQIAGGGIRGWMLTVWPSVWMPVVGGSLIAGLYSFYEIEASVIVRPPGMNNLPQQLLSDLHYARLEQLSAAGVNLLLIGFLGSLIAMLLLVSFGNSERTER